MHIQNIRCNSATVFKNNLDLFLFSDEPSMAFVNNGLDDRIKAASTTVQEPRVGLAQRDNIK